MTRAWWWFCWFYYARACKEIHIQHPDVLVVHLKRLHYERLLGFGVTRRVCMAVVSQRLRDSCTGPVYSDGGEA